MTFGVQREDLGGARETLLPVQRHQPAGAPGRPAHAAGRRQDRRHAAGHVDSRHRQADGQLPVPVPAVGQRVLPVPRGIALHPHGQRGERARAQSQSGQRGDSRRRAQRRQLRRPHLVDCASTTTCRSQRLEHSLALDIFNATNTNTITRVNSLSGTTFNRVTEFVPPRVVRFGVKVRF